jgi:DNA-binding XRE family transcriptional regulator
MKISIKAARVNAGFNIADAAAHVGHKRASLWRWESGRDKIPPNIKTALCRLYGVAEADIRETDCNGPGGASQ